MGWKGESMGKESTSITYRSGMSGADICRYIKAVGLPIGVFLLAMFAIDRFAAFGSNLIAPLTGVMWAAGAACALILPSHRSTILNETHVTIACYLLALTGIRELIALVSGVSSEMLMASYNQAIPLTSGSTVSGYLQTLLWISAIMTPLGFIGMQGKRIYSFRRKASKQKFFDQTRSIRDAGHSHNK